MIRINLLPHREQSKEAHRHRFQILLAAAIVTAGLVVASSYLVLDSRIGHQQHRNQYLQEAIAQLDGQIKKIEGLKKERDDLLARKQLVEQLQQGRNEATHIFDQLVRQTPDGVYLRDFKQTGRNFDLSGYALSGARVSNYMRSLAQSTAFNAPALVEVKAAIVNNQRVSEFTLRLGMKGPEQSEPTDGKKGSRP